MKPLNILTAALFGAAVLPATAAQFDFYKLDQPTAAGDFLPTNGAVCTTYDRCSSNVDGGVFGGTLDFSDGGISLMASGSYMGEATRASAVQDSTNDWTASKGAGLGVYHQVKVTSDDNITFNEVLTITFDQVVNLTNIGLRAEGHNFTAWTPGATFLLNGVQTLLPQNVGSLNLNMVGQVFTFGFDNASQTGDQFYLSSMTANPVPEPESIALLIAGLGGIGLMARRRRLAA
jgi:hypothetical protein